MANALASNMEGTSLLVSVQTAVQYFHTLLNVRCHFRKALYLWVVSKGVGPGPTLAWPGWKQPDIPVEVDTDRLETSRWEAGVLKKLSLASIAKLSWLKYR